MDPITITILCCIVVAIAIGLVLVYQSKSAKTGQKDRQAPQPRQQQQAGGVRRAQVARGVRQRHRPQAADQDDSDQDHGNDGAGPPETELPEGKVGAKKLAKMQAKAERKVQLEVEQREREDRKKKQQLEEEERRKVQEREELEEKKREEQERKALEEKERKEHEEYLKMKAAFNVEEEGFDEMEGDAEGNLLNEFVMFIKENKVIVLEDLASHFRLKTQDVINRIQDLQTEGNLTGVIDDRGKFIYISQEELESVAKFVNQRGRVSITDLAESSNKLINLDPTARSEACPS